MSMSQPYSHDAFFRENFSRREVAVGYLQNYLPEPIRAVLDIPNLTPEQGSFIDEELAAHHTDMLFRVPRTDRPEEPDAAAYVYILMEHKSAPDPMVALQLLRYMTRIWAQQVRDAGGGAVRLRPIVPLVFYHGDRRWLVDKAFSALVDAPDGWAAHVPQFDYILSDLSYLSDETLRGPRLTRIVLWTLRAAFDPAAGEQLAALLASVARLPQPLALAILRLILYYFSYNATRIDMQQLRAVVQQIPPPLAAQGVDDLMTIAEQLLAQGEERGKTKGRAEGRAEGKAEGRAEGRTEGRTEGRIVSTQDKILDLLRLRFDVSDAALAAAVRAIDDQARLDALFVAAVRAADADAFRVALATRLP